MTSEQKTALAAQIKKAIEEKIDENNPELIKAKIMELSALQGSAAALQAGAKKGLLKREGELLKQYMKEDIPPTVLMRKINAECAEEQGWLTYCERLGAGLSHGVDGLRSVLSFIKMEMENSRHQTT